MPLQGCESSGGGADPLHGVIGVQVPEPDEAVAAAGRPRADRCYQSPGAHIASNEREISEAGR